MASPNGPLRVGLGGPVGAGKTTLTAALARALRDRLSMAVVTNDIYTREDAEELMRQQVLPLDRIKGVETGGCPHTAIREDASINLAAIAELKRGRTEFRSDRSNIVHCPVGKVSMEAPDLAENISIVVDEIVKRRPADAKGNFVQSVAISSTMGPGVKLDFDDAQ